MPLFKPHIRGETKAKVRDEVALSGNYEDVLNFAMAGKHRGYVSADVALKNSDIYSAVMQLSSDLAGIKFTTSSGRIESFVQNPSATSNGRSFWTSVFAQLLLGGESFVYRWRNINGVDLRWEYLRPSQVQPFLLDDGSGLIYNLNFDEPDIGLMQAVPAGDVLHFRLVSQNGGMTALSPLAALTDELHIKKASNDLTMSALNQAVTSPGVLKVTKGGLLNAQEKADRSKQFITQERASGGGPIVLDDLEEYSPLEVKGNVAQLLSQTDWTSRQIAKVYGIPDSFLNGQGDQQSSIDQITGMYVKALNRYAQFVVSEFDSKLRANFEADLWPVVDPMGSNFAGSTINLSKGGIISSDQGTWLLQHTGYLPDDLPAPKKTPKVAVEPPTKQEPEGGENE